MKSNSSKNNLNDDYKGKKGLNVKYKFKPNDDCENETSLQSPSKLFFIYLSNFLFI